MATRSTRNGRIICGLCDRFIDEAQYRAHVAQCNRDDDQNQPVKKVCALCGENVDDLAQHYQKCTGGNNTTNDIYRYQQRSPVPQDYQRSPKNVSRRQSNKKCAVCDEMIPEEDYVTHVNGCIPRSSPKSTESTRIKECIICLKVVPEADYTRHVDACLNRNQPSPKLKNTKECIICFKEIVDADYVHHVNACISGSSSRTDAKPANKQNQIVCFSCSSPVNSSKGSSHAIPCRSHHIYCLKCLRRSMDECIQSNTVPTCHSASCDYQFSRHDVTCLPVEPDTITRLLTLVKTTQRPQCPLCLFYVNFDIKGDLEKHAGSCNAENLIPCEYCHCLYNMHRLDDHARQCRNVPLSQQRQAFIDFILPRIKYPLTAAQIRAFMEHRKKNHLLLDPHSIVDALAEFEGAFPFEVPTRDCDVCMEACIYDDIFVFGCDESHKLCYVCFEQSCTTKMSSNEVLTCAACAYQLQEGELKQLRVPADRKRQFLEYQMQKTFNAYSANKQGMIKCPKQGCKWVAEAQNPNDRFQVTCPVCHHEFCSLCNQQYHFRTTCQQVPEITQRWFFWCNTERGNYWQARAQQDATFNAQLQDFERQRAANMQRNAELQQRYNELLADEDYKTKNCRLCPHCRRVVQHLGGCDLMVCGRNYHGGDDQSGCGKGFNFSQALPYTPIGNTGPQQVRTDMPPPEQQKTIVHEGIECDACHNVVQGIRFDCIHCSSLIFCEKCEQRSTLEHANQIRDEQKQQHVFQLIARP